MTHLEKFNILDAKVKRLEKMRSELVAEIHHIVINHFEEVSGVAVGKVVKYKGRKCIIQDVLITKIECQNNSKHYGGINAIKGKVIKKDGSISQQECYLNEFRIIYENGFNFSRDYWGVGGVDNI